MISTLLNYRLYTNNMARTLEQVASQAQTERAKAYYDSHIGGVATVDEFLDDYKLYSYAMKAYGLEDQINAKGLMRKVLESDLTDSNSFANKLVDKRYQAFAKAFDFSSGTKDPQAQTTAQSALVTEAYTDRLSRTGPLAAQAAASFTAAVAGATSLDDILANRANVDFALRAVGIDDPSLFPTDYVRSVLEGRAATPIPAGLADLRTRLTQASTPAGRADVVSRLVYDYYNETGNGSTPGAAQANVDYFTQKVQPTQTAAAFVADTRLLQIALTGVGFELTSYSADYVLPLLKDATAIDRLVGVSDTDKARFRQLNQTMGFDANGTATNRGSGSLQTLTGRYLQNYATAQTGKDNLAAKVYLAAMQNVDSVSDLTGQAVDSLRYAMRAFDIDPATTSLNKIRAVLTSDPSDPASYVSKLKDERFSKLAAAFNFGADGKAGPAQGVQTTSQQTQTGTLYAASFGADVSTAQKALIKSATESYLTGISKAYSLDSLLSDKRTVAFALKAYGVENANLSTAELRKILTSDLSDPKSYANTQADKAIAKFAAAFQFEPDGSVREAGQGIQFGATKLATDNLYLLQSLEEKAGETSEGTRLALYALRTAPTITSAYGILADKALFQVVRTALGLPEGMAAADIETQVRVLEAKLDVKDFADPKSLDKFIARFAALYDAQNTDASQNPILQLFGASSVGSGIASIL
ncbi:DUF1217 domain-containing protein [Aureimonas jatrophae]|uniref:Uncharacterized protein n=1 Tax=Aureimonas jatrophae TaxID=1166073 RepID=A0A1H0JHP3_9HYPH|nr:DUF1217 domain-containing protein [Aureimonas jatrophae]MBB3951415.1 hypothetical protein [Aureimonas jatrophae]SDO42993.1 Protein of unknown function [Aureimonas jatrophae]